MQYAEHGYHPEAKGVSPSGVGPYSDLESGGQPMAGTVESCAVCPPEVRAGFIRKVYGILSAQLLFTALVRGHKTLCTGHPAPRLALQLALLNWSCSLLCHRFLPGARFISQLACLSSPIRR